MKTNRRWLVANAHDGAGVENMSLSLDHFRQDEQVRPEPAEGQVLIRSLYFATDPMNHAWVRGVPGRFEAIPVGEPMRGGVAGVVVASRHPDFHEGDQLTGFLDWCDFNLSTGHDRLGEKLQVIPPDIAIVHGLSALGMTGICAWLSVCDFGATQPGDTVMVSGASGAIGSLAGQVAKIAGAKVIGTARGEEKCRFVSGQGFDQVPAAALGQFTAANFGRKLICVGS